tara:strand:- start:66 stop:494 length:429 start_codon:yes stop_codon:yes gene_type:complete
VSLLKSIAETIEEEIDAEAVAKALDSAEAMAEEKLFASELHIAKEGISLLRGNKEAIAGLTKGAALSVLASIALGEKDKALEFSQVSLLSFNERRSLMKQETKRTIEVADRASASREAIFKIFQEGGRLLVSKALPFVLAAL